MALLALAQRPRPLEIGLLDLTVQILVDGAVFLIGEAFARDVQESRLPGAVGDHHLLELGLEEPETDGDVVVVAAVEIGFFIHAQKAEVAELEFDAVIGWRVAG